MEALAVIWAPVRTLARVAEERQVLLGFGVTALYAALSVIIGAISFFGGFMEPRFQPGEPQPPLGFEELLRFAGVFSIISGATTPFISWLLVSALMQLVTRFFGGTGPFSGMLAAVGVAQAPLAIATAIQIPLTVLQVVLTPESSTIQEETPAAIAALVLGLLSGVVSLAALVWFVVLLVVGATFARHVGYGESAGSCAISCVGCVGLIILVFVVIVAIFAVVVSAFNSAGTT